MPIPCSDQRIWALASRQAAPRQCIMGQLRFRLQERDRLPDDALSRIFVAGADEFPWSTRSSWRGDELVVNRAGDDSGAVYVPWRVDGHGQYLLASSTLIERDRPYLLEVELARGMIQRLRTRLFLWEWLGLKTPSELASRLQEA